MLINGFKSMDNKLLSLLKNPAIAKLVNALSDGDMSSLDYESGELVDTKQILRILTHGKQKHYGRDSRKETNNKVTLRVERQSGKKYQRQK